MSDFDEVDFDAEDMGLDEDDLSDIFDNNEDSITPEEAFKIVTINKVKGTTVKVTLTNKDNDEVELGEVVEQLLEYIKDKIEDGDNQFINQLMPLIAQGTVSALSRIAGLQHTAAYLSNETTKSAFIHSMAIGFLLLKFVQQQELTINTFEEDISEEEIEDIERRSRAASVATLGSLSGLNPEEILKEMVNQEMISEEDLEKILGTNGDDDGDDEGEDNS